MTTEATKPNAKLIEASKIEPNKMNSRSVKEEDVNNIAQSIEVNGLLQPLVVYQKSNGKYCITSGHRRFAAIQKLRAAGKWQMENDTIPCIIHDNPNEDWKERELLSIGNIHRSTKEEIVNEVKLANDNWNSIPPEDKEVIARNLKMEFITKHCNEEAYQKDPGKFIMFYFRARLEYIRKITGLTQSNTIIKEMLNEILKQNSETFNTETKTEEKKTTKAKEKVYTLADVSKNADKLRGTIIAYENGDGFDQAYQNNIDELLQAIDNFLGVVEPQK